MAKVGRRFWLFVNFEKRRQRCVQYALLQRQLENKVSVTLTVFLRLYTNKFTIFSAYRGGSPGFDDPSPPWSVVPPIYISEVFSHTDPPFVDSVELYNPTDQRVDLTGFSLSDDPTPRGWRAFTFPFQGRNRTIQLAPNVTIDEVGERITHIEPRSFLTLSELKLNFSLSSLGESIYLFHSELGSPVVPDGYVDGVEYPPVDNGKALVRRINSFGQPVWVRAEW